MPLGAVDDDPVQPELPDDPQGGADIVIPIDMLAASVAVAVNAGLPAEKAIPTITGSAARRPGGCGNGP